jgi:Flp pilus assembly pilin Flp
MSDRFRSQEKIMEFLTKPYVKASEWYRGTNQGQTMTEYALILAAIAIVVFVAYQSMGTTLTTMVSSVNGQI